MDKEAKPLKSIGNPVTCLFELDSDIAFVMILSNFMAHDVETFWKGCNDATWQTLANLSQEPTLIPHPRIAGPAFENFCDEGILGLDIASGKLETVVVAILNECVMVERSAQKTSIKTRKL